MDASERVFTTGQAWQIVIVNYRTPSLAVKAAQQARVALGDEGHVTVVDSDSGDQSCQQLGQVKDIEVVALQKNMGFGAALNAGAKDHHEPFIICANADVIITAEVLSVLAQRLRENPSLGIVGPRLESPNGRVQPSCRRFPTHLNLMWSRVWSPLRRLAPERWSYVLPEPPVFSYCDVVAGACIAVRRELWNAIGGMDETYFLFAEDTDLCRRAKSAGWLIAYEPGVCVRHEWGASTSQNRPESAKLQAGSMTTYLSRHFPDRWVANWLLSAIMKIYVRLRPTGPSGL